MSILGIDLFKSPKEKEDEKKAYFDRMFPMGAAQKEWEDRIYGEVFSAKKDELPVLRYIGFITKELYQDGMEHAESSPQYKNWRKLVRRMKISETDLAQVVRIVRGELEANALSELPDAKSLLCDNSDCKQ